MESNWSESKAGAIRMRKRGQSIRNIETRLGIPRSTLSGWFQGIELTRQQKDKLQREWGKANIGAREKASAWHRQQKQRRLKEAREQALGVLAKLDISDRQLLELSLAILYLGEGTKKKPETSLGSSDPDILRFFLRALQLLYKISADRIGCDLYLRADQNPKTVKRYWAKTLSLPRTCFKRINIDKRTLNSKTYPNYNGVCSIRCASSVAIQRRLLYLGEEYCQSILRQFSGN